MVHQGQRLLLSLKTRDDFPRLHPQLQNLESNNALQLNLLSFENLTEATRLQPLDNSESPDDLNNLALGDSKGLAASSPLKWPLPPWFMINADFQTVEPCR